jgi:hypothetical protein
MNFTKIALKIELNQIKIWLRENDYKVNKHILGEYQDDDERWTDYLQERSVKLARYNDIEHELLTTEWVDDVIPQPVDEVVDDVVEQVVDEVVDDIIPIEEQINYSYEDIEAAKNMDVVEDLETTEEVIEDVVDDLETVEETDSTDEDTEKALTE